MFVDDALDVVRQGVRSRCCDLKERSRGVVVHSGTALAENGSGLYLTEGFENIVGGSSWGESDWGLALALGQESSRRE